jgi:hypothetical protein
VGRNWIWVVPLGCLTPILLVGGCFVVSVVAIFGLLKSSEAYTRSLAAVTANEKVQAALGQPIEPSTIVTGNINVSTNGSHADVYYSISGPKGDGSVHAVADKRNGVWVFSTNRVVLNPRRKRSTFRLDRNTTIHSYAFCSRATGYHYFSEIAGRRGDLRIARGPPLAQKNANFDLLGPEPRQNRGVWYLDAYRWQ